MNPDKNLNHLNKDFKLKVDLFLQEVGDQIFVYEGYRSQARQNYLYSLGRTRPGKIVTKTLHSNHSTGKAIDIAFKGTIAFPRDINKWKKIAKVASKYGIDWGYDLWGWDAVHFQDNGVPLKPRETLWDKWIMNPLRNIYGLAEVIINKYNIDVLIKTDGKIEGEIKGKKYIWVLDNHLNPVKMLIDTNTPKVIKDKSKKNYIGIHQYNQNTNEFRFSCALFAMIGMFSDLDGKRYSIAEIKDLNKEYLNNGKKTFKAAFNVINKSLGNKYKFNSVIMGSKKWKEIIKNQTISFTYRNPEDLFNDIKNDHKIDKIFNKGKGSHGMRIKYVSKDMYYVINNYKGLKGKDGKVIENGFNVSLKLLKENIKSKAFVGMSYYITKR